ncbi:MAG: hypothetical protein JNL88_12380 [Bacteroidia bacterium]|nr:hypothetical protein [Bacteroidia bacterium]
MKGVFRIIRPGHLLFALIGVMAACLLVLRILLAGSYLPETGGVSINVMYGIIRMLEGSFLYTHPEMPPFPIIQYMPLHFYLVKSLVQLSGNSHDVHAVLITSRFFCLLIDCLSVVLIARTLIRFLSLPTLTAWSMALIYFLSIPGIIYGRVDNLYLFFFLATISLLIKSYTFPEGRIMKWLPGAFLAGAITALAIATKQTGVFLAAYCFIHYLFIEKSTRQWLLYAVGLLACSVLLALWILPGSIPDFKLNVVDGVKNGINVNWFTEVILKNFFLKFSYILAAGFMVAYLLFKDKRTTLHTFLGFGIAWYFVIATLTSFKAGSGPNYYLEFIALSIFGLALLLRQETYLNGNSVLFALALSPFFLLAAANDKGWGDIGLMKKAKADYAHARQVAAYVLPELKTGEWILTDFHKESTLNLHLADRALFPCREVALYFTRPLGVFHFDAFGQLVQNGRIPFIIEKKNKPLQEFLDVSLNKYEADTTIGNYTVYRRSTK